MNNSGRWRMWWVGKQSLTTGKGPGNRENGLECWSVWKLGGEKWLTSAIPQYFVKEGTDTKWFMHCFSHYWAQLCGRPWDRLKDVPPPWLPEASVWFQEGQSDRQVEICKSFPLLFIHPIISIGHFFACPTFIFFLLIFLLGITPQPCCATCATYRVGLRSKPEWPGILSLEFDFWMEWHSNEK